MGQPAVIWVDVARARVRLVTFQTVKHRETRSFHDGSTDTFTLAVSVSDLSGTRLTHNFLPYLLELEHLNKHPTLFLFEYTRESSTFKVLDTALNNPPVRVVL